MALLASIWQSVLQLPADEAARDLYDAPFATLGGDSVASVQVVSLAQRKLNHPISPICRTPFLPHLTIEIPKIGYKLQPPLFSPSPIPPPLTPSSSLRPA